MSQQHTDGVRTGTIVVMGLVGVTVGMIVGAVLLSGCSSTPPPRPLPEPRSQRDTPQRDAQRPASTEPERTDTPDRTAQADEPASEPPTPTTPTTPTIPGQPEWFRDGAFVVDGREHRAFAVTAGDVRDARGRAMAMAYERYPRGRVAAHEAVRQDDGRWRFYLLMAQGG